jgi:hypothetical protein
MLQLIHIVSIDLQAVFCINQDGHKLLSTIVFLVDRYGEIDMPAIGKPCLLVIGTA